ncbi:MAG: flavodoxin family protein [Tannerellaceae bacterium]|nr:flavodoxin family protein [Tannerellaceae bacterium]
MLVIGINGSPRKHGNTATLLEKALEGAEVAGAKTKLIHLYKYTYQGCISCFACKKKGKEKYVGRCAMKDELTHVLHTVMEADAVILGSPVYMNNITGMMQSFLERLLFPCVSYGTQGPSQYTGQIHAGMIYTMNMTEKQLAASGFESMIRTQDATLQLLNGKVEKLICTDTYQFRNYNKYEAGGIDEPHKAQVRLHQFPVDCEKAYELGLELAAAFLPVE